MLNFGKPRYLDPGIFKEKKKKKEGKSDCLMFYFSASVLLRLPGPTLFPGEAGTDYEVQYFNHVKVNISGFVLILLSFIGNRKDMNKSL